MDPSRRIVVAVRPASALDDRPRLAVALEQAFPIRLRAWRPGDPSADAVIEIGAGAHAAATGHGVPTLTLAGGTRDDSSPEPVRLAAHAPVDRRVRGVVLRDRLTAPLEDVGEVEAVLARAGSEPAWVMTREAPARHRVRSALPELGPGEVLYRLLSRRALAMVALLHFLRAVTGAPPPPLRACFVFDDPNLRWRSYGFIDYRRLVAHADEHGYHAAMAMIPLDAGRPHPAIAALFRSRADRLSLVVHGNDHIDNELLSAGDDATALALAAQAVRRIERFERRSGVGVERVMMPPHGLCSAAMAGALARLGFDALCALHAQPWTAEPPGDPLLAGWRAAELVRGCPVIPRVPLCSSDADLALRALLDHPLIVYGHHEDVAGGLEPLADMAARVNRLGDVRWTSVGEIALANHELAVDGDRAVVAPYARRARVRLPAGVRSVTVAQPEDEAGALAGWSAPGGGPLAFGEAMPVHGGAEVELALVAVGALEPAAVAPPAWRPWPRLRRVATEARDRARPLRARSATA